MDAFEAAYRLNIKIFVFFGFYSIDKSTLSICWRIFVLFVITCSFAFCTIMFIVDIQSVHEFRYALTFMTNIVNIVNKILCVVVYQSEIFQMNDIFIKIKVNEQCNIIENANANAVKLVRIRILLLNIATVVYAVYVLIVSENTRTFLIPIPLFVENKALYYVAFLVNTIQCLGLGVIILAADTFPSTFMMLLEAHIECLCIKLKSVSKDNIVDLLDIETSIVQLKHCIEYNVQLIKVNILFNQCYCVAFCIQSISMTLNLCILIYELQEVR